MSPGSSPKSRGGMPTTCLARYILLTVGLLAALEPACALGQRAGQSDGQSRRSTASDQRQRSSSHRELQLPMQREPNLAEQFRLLQQLRTMVDSPAAEPPPTSGERGLDPALLEAARKMFPEQAEMLERLRDGLSEEDLQRLREAWAGTQEASAASPNKASPGASPLNSETLEKLREANPALGQLLDDPRVRQRAEEMLREFQQNGKLPEGLSAGGRAGMLPPPPDHSATGNGPEKGSGPQTSSAGSVRPTEPSTSASPPEVTDSAPGGTATGSRRPGAGTGESQPRVPTSPAAQNALESAGSGTNPGGNLQTKPLAPAQTGNARVGSSPTNVPQPRLRRSNDEPVGTSVEPGGGRTTAEPARDGSLPSRQNSSSLPSTDAGTGDPGANWMEQYTAGGSNPTGSPKPSLKDILERVDSDPSSLPPLTVPNSSIEYFKDWLSERGVKKAERSDLFDKLKGAIPEKVRADLKDRGLDETLSKIVDEARGGLGSGGGQDSASSLFGGEVGADSQTKSLQDRIAQLAEKAGQAREPGKANSRSDKSRPAPAANGKEEGGEKKKGPAEAINDFFKNLASPSEDKAPTAASSTGPQTATLPWGMLVPLAVVLLVVGLVGWAYGTRSSAPSQGIDNAILNNLQITSRADVVRAFHLLAHQQAGEVETWWTHRRLARSWAGQQPLVREQVEALTRLYEIARYRPASADLSESELRDARAAMERLRTC